MGHNLTPNRNVRVRALVWILVCLLSVILLLGCQRRLQPVKATGSFAPLALELQSNTDIVKIGEPVHLILTVTNTAAAGPPEIIESSDQPVVDIKVSGADLVQPRWSSGQPLENIPHRLELAPGETLRIEWTWTPSQLNRNEHTIAILGVLVYREGRSTHAILTLPVTY